MSNKEISKLFEKVDKELLSNVNHSVVVMNEDKVIYSTEISKKLDNPYEFDVSAFLPNAENMTLDRFYNIAKDLIEDSQVRSGVLEDLRVKVVEEYPPERFDKIGVGDEVICFRLLKREPANMDTKAVSRPHRKSTYYYDYNSPLAPNKNIVVESRPVDHRIEFTCWGKNK